MKTTVLLSAPYMLPFVDRFRPIFAHYGIEIITADVQERMEENEILAYAGQFDGTICGDDRYSANVLEKCSPRLKVVSKWGTGIDSIDQEAADRLGIRVGNTPNAFTLPVADNVMGYILAFARQQPWMDQEMKRGFWNKIPCHSLSEVTIGVIGVGNIGSAVLHRAQAFGAELLGNDIVPIAHDFITENKMEMTSLQDLLERSDFISMNCDLNPTSYHLINTQSLSWVKPHAVLINTARGPLIDEEALIQALENKKIAGAALDVFEHEPLPNSSPLLQMDNVMLAPHNSNSSPQAWEHVHWNSLHNLLEGLNIDHKDLQELAQKH
jgi:D-3-phosphoglycerate dehydrogenase / 2-oxoglutarate reductase